MNPPSDDTMPHQSEVEAELIGITRQLIESHLSRADDALERCYALLTPDLNGFGTGVDEMANSREEFMLSIQHEYETVPQLNHHTSGEQAQVLNAGAALVRGFLTIEVPIGEEETIPVKFRFTHVYRQTDGRWQVAHIHISRPDTEQMEGEALPVDALRARNLELERLVTERTAEIETARRESEIESALERIRSRTMTMQESAELGAVIQVVFREALQLGFGAKACDLVILDETTGGSSFWISGELDELGEAVHFQLPKLNHTHYAATLNAWARDQAVRQTVLEGEVCADYMRQLTESAEASNMPDEVKTFLQELRYIIHTEAYMRHGYFRVASLEPLDQDAESILQRIAHVFEQTYTRFLDLRKAEAQAREAQIEAALERVRSRAMSMRSSDELKEVAAELRYQMGLLGQQDLEVCMIHLYDDDPDTFDSWGAIRPPGHKGAVLTDQMRMPRKPAIMQEVLALYASEKTDYVVVNEGEKGLEWMGVLQEKVPQLFEMLRPMLEGDEPLRAYWAFSDFSGGSVGMVTYQPPDQPSRNLLRRCARVFDLAYKRFEDLKQAEARAREAEQQACIDRVRAEIASMRDADDLQRITPIVWRELTALGVPFFRCGVFIMDEAIEEMQAFLTDPQGNPLAAMHLPYTTAQTTEAAVARWRKQQVYTEVWDRQQFIDWTRSIMAKGLIETTDEYGGIEDPPETLALHFAPFRQGMLYVGNNEPLGENAIDAVQALADAFAVAYARYEDFQRLEAKRQEVEAALADLKAAQQQLVHSEKMASLGALTAGIAHEIKNPLNFVNNFAALSQELIDELEDETDPEEIEAILADLKVNAEKIEEHGKRADGIVRSMLEHSRSGSGERQATNLNALVNEYVDLAYHGKRAQTPDFNTDLQKDLDPTVGQVEILPQEIGRVLINLLGNAFDAVYQHATAMGEVFAPCVTVLTRRTGKHIEIRVEDNGPGIPPEVKAKIFEPFFTTKPTGSGTGLGLSMSYDIITQGHGGTLDVESEPGEGAAFVVTIPAQAMT